MWGPVRMGLRRGVVASGLLGGPAFARFLSEPTDCERQIAEEAGNDCWCSPAACNEFFAAHCASSRRCMPCGAVVLAAGI